MLLVYGTVCLILKHVHVAELAKTLEVVALSGTSCSKLLQQASVVSGPPAADGGAVAANPTRVEPSSAMSPDVLSKSRPHSNAQQVAAADALPPESWTARFQQLGSSITHKLQSGPAKASAPVQQQSWQIADVIWQVYKYAIKAEFRLEQAATAVVWDAHVQPGRDNDSRTPASCVIASHPPSTCIVCMTSQHYICRVQRLMSDA